MFVEFLKEMLRLELVTSTDTPDIKPKLSSASLIILEEVADSVEMVLVSDASSVYDNSILDTVDDSGDIPVDDANEADGGNAEGKAELVGPGGILNSSRLKEFSDGGGTVESENLVKDSVLIIVLGSEVVLEVPNPDVRSNANRRRKYSGACVAVAVVVFGRSDDTVDELIDAISTNIEEFLGSPITVAKLVFVGIGIKGTALETLS